MSKIAETENNESTNSTSSSFQISFLEAYPKDLDCSFGWDLIRATKKFKNPNDISAFYLRLKKYEGYIQRISKSLYERLEDDDKEVFLQFFLMAYTDVELLINLKEKVIKPISYETVYKLEKEYYKKLHHTNSKLKKEDVFINGTKYIKSFINNLEIIWPDVNHGNGLNLTGVENEYSYKNVHVREEDTIIDAGGAIGDSVLEFYENAKGHLKIHSFELLSDNIMLYNKNMELNKIGKDIFKLNQLALSSKSNEEFYIYDFLSPFSSRIDINKDIAYDKELHYDESSKSKVKIKTITLDDYAKENKLEKVDFIKMDIEGAELAALEGATEVIRKYKPRLAICIYHIWTDPFLIPELILKLNPNYKFYFKWSLPIVNDIGAWEGVLFAIDANEEVKPNPSKEMSRNEMLEFISEFVNRGSKLLNESLIYEVGHAREDKWYRFGKLSRKKKIMKVMGVISRRLGIYRVMKLIKDLLIKK